MLILDLPNEIQSEIFTFAHRDNGTLLLPVEVILSHVCSEWRDIVINLPILWTAFKFEAHRRTSVPFDKLEEYLSRSKTQLLELYFDIYFPNISLANQYFTLLDIVIAQAYRWRRFTLFTDLKGRPIGIVEGLHRLNGLRQLNAPNLEYFAMCLAGVDWDAPDPGHINPSVLIGGAPRLSVIRIDTASHLHSLPPLSNMNTLTIQDPPFLKEYLCSFHTFRSILMVPTLTYLSIEPRLMVYPPSFGDLETLPPIVMPSLRTLRITRCDSILFILWLLHAPLLETLMLHRLETRPLSSGLRISTTSRPLPCSTAMAPPGHFTPATCIWSTLFSTNLPCAQNTSSYRALTAHRQSKGIPVY
ncbi:hypothetical protein M413DRAFT_246947 [Hebeloma cylindrosporum]|uniref:Uncharacterized protein n=1 Tax=Hebeloma cylindrosporum TaxID=76867 RepID=A0A0C2XK80_HEBCY|nr:hypothetical protein M413DRAFT_246947 [Hebeloma cylindrosporum h7]